MSSLEIGLIALLIFFGSAMLAMVVGHLLPRHHLSDQTRTAVSVAMAVVGTMSALVLQLRIVPVSIVGAPGLFVVLDAPREPLPKQLARLWSQENSAGEDMTDGVHGHTKLW
jgi:hypothetical protein